MTERPSTDPRVYPTREDSELLLPYATAPPGSRLLEIGCGAGAASLAAARAGVRVVATDLNPWALRGLASIARRERLPIETVRTDLAGGLRRFERILANPPYLPTPAAARDPDHWVNLALDGGPDGLRVTRRLFGTLPDHLVPGGQVFLVISSRQAPDELARLRHDWTARVGQVCAVAHRDLGAERLEVWELTRFPAST
jgi:release factor glutamine methyltransferase